MEVVRILSSYSVIDGGSPLCTQTPLLCAGRVWIQPRASR